MADLFMNLRTNSCEQQSQKAIKYEGQIALESSFGILGEVAMGDIFTNPDVDAAASGMEKYIDSEKLNSSLGFKRTQN